MSRRWTTKEDERLRHAVSIHCEKNWKAVAEIVQSRDAYECYQHWRRVLRPSISHSPFSENELRRLAFGVRLYGEHKWSDVARGLEGRTDCQCRTQWLKISHESASSSLSGLLLLAALSPSSAFSAADLRQILSLTEEDTAVYERDTAAVARAFQLPPPDTVTVAAASSCSSLSSALSAGSLRSQPPLSESSPLVVQWTTSDSEQKMLIRPVSEFRWAKRSDSSSSVAQLSSSSNGVDGEKRKRRKRAAGCVSRKKMKTPSTRVKDEECCGDRDTERVSDDAEQDEECEGRYAEDSCAFGKERSNSTVTMSNGSTTSSSSSCENGMTTRRGSRASGRGTESAAAPASSSSRRVGEGEEEQVQEEEKEREAEREFAVVRRRRKRKSGRTSVRNGAKRTLHDFESAVLDGRVAGFAGPSGTLQLPPSSASSSSSSSSSGSVSSLSSSGSHSPLTSNHDAP